MKHVFITGANGGLGFSAVKLLLDRGYVVHASDVNLNNLKNEKNDNLFVYKMNVKDIKNIEKVFNEVKKNCKELEAIINFAGILYMDSLIEVELSKLENLLDINIMGPVRVNKTFFPLIEKNKGRIINISSETAYLTSPPFNGPYTMTKYALEAYNDSLRRELQMIGIKVINLQLGSFKTDMHKDTLNSFAELQKRTKYFKNELSKMGSMMTYELEHANSFEHMHKALLKALEEIEPKTCYKVRNSIPQQAISLLPEKTIDKIFKNMLK